MNLGEYIAYQLLEVELSGDIKHIVALYPGRFQPMGTHHAKTYNWVQSKFGDAWVVTSDKVQLPKSPLNFNEKKKIINKHGIRKVAKVKNPYQAVEVLSKYDPKTTAAVFIVGKKDQERLGGKFFRPWQGVAEVGYGDGAYTMIAPHISLNIPGVGEMSGTTIRQALSQSPDTPESKRLFKGIMGWYDTGIHKMISGKLMVNDIIEKFINNSDFTDALHEASVTSISQAGDVDDGPQTWYKNQSNYKSATQHIAQKLGMKVLNYLSGDDDFEAELTRYQHITRSPSTFPAGAQGKTTTINQDDLSTKAAYKVWRNYIQNIATSVGMQFLDYLGAEYSVNVDEPNTELDGLLGEGLLVEGGAAGHMSHPFDDNNLTFGDIKDIIRLSLQGNLSMEKVATEKCISGDSILFLEKLGPTKIKDVVDGNLDDSVLAYNSQDDKNEYLPIVHKFNNGPADEWIVIELEDGKEIKVTPNHKIFVEGKGFVRADELTEDDELKIV